MKVSIIVNDKVMWDNGLSEECYCEGYDNSGNSYRIEYDVIDLNLEYEDMCDWESPIGIYIIDEGNDDTLYRKYHDRSKYNYVHGGNLLEENKMEISHTDGRLTFSLTID